MKYDQEKPTIMVGYEEKHYMCNLVDEVAHGIEEEGCLCEKYILKGLRDIRMSIAGVVVILYGEKGFLHVSDLKNGDCLYSVRLSKPGEYRRIGQNASRYLKNMKLNLL